MVNRVSDIATIQPNQLKRLEKIQPVEPIEPNLVEIIPRKRTWKNIKAAYLNPQKIFALLSKSRYPYSYDLERKQDEDLAYSCCTYATCGRASEILKIRYEQVVEHNKKFLLIERFEVSKRKKRFLQEEITKLFKQEAKELSKSDRKKLLIRYQKIYKQTNDVGLVDIPLPRLGPLAPFTKAFEDYITNYPPTNPKDRIFKFTRGTAWKKVRYISSSPESIDEKKPDGIFIHYLRGQGLSWNLRQIRSTSLVARDRGIVASSTLDHYFVSQWLDHQKDFYKNISR
jgi:hypothetical protein